MEQKISTTRMRKSELIKGFEKWAKKNKVLKDTSAELYGSYLNYLKKEEYFAKDFKNIFETIEEFYKDGDTLFALTYCDKLFADFKDTKKNYADKSDEWSNSRSAIVKLLMYLSSKGITCNSGDNLDNIRCKIKKPNIHKIDGVEGLVSKLGINEFVQMAIEQSYFIHPSIVVKRHEELEILFTSNSTREDKYILDARKSQNEDNERIYRYKQIKDIINPNWYHYKEGKLLDFLIKQDNNGNVPVRSVINRFTGYTMCGGEDSIFQNFIISHIWGRAFDPRYFTSLWNVVIIPAWANPLMDKIGPEEGSPASILQSTFMAICHKLYFDGYPFENQMIKIDNWKGIKIDKEPSILCSKDVIGSDICSDKVYNIKLLGKKDELSKAKVGKISVEPVKI